MARSERLARFLEFTVSETLAGNADQIKEFVVGVEVFGRTQDYDPRLDPIVRVEARRLRMKLRKYYDTEGQDDRIRIEYPKGSYVPAISPFRPEDRPTEPMYESRRAIVVLPFSSLGESESFAAAVGEGLISKLIQMEDLRVVAWNSTLRLKATPRDYARLGDQLNVHGVVEGKRRAGFRRSHPRRRAIDRRAGRCVSVDRILRAPARRNRIDPRLHRRRSRPSPASPLRRAATLNADSHRLKPVPTG